MKMSNLDHRLLVEIENDVNFLKVVRSTHSFGEVQRDIELRYAMLKALENIGEATHRLSFNFRKEYDPKNKINFDRYKMERNYIVHQYYDTSSTDYLIFLWNKYIPEEIFKLGNFVNEILTPLRKQGIKDGELEYER